MNECRKFEKLLWIYPDLDQDEQAALAQHLEGCSKCQGAQETIRVLRDSSEYDKQMLNRINSEAFDQSVLARIHRRPVRLILHETSGKQYDVRMAFSFLAAAAMVILILRSVSDLGPIEVKRPMPPMLSSSEGRRVINIQLGKEADVPPAYDSAPANSTNRDADAFSILTGPITAPSPESVNIDAVFVASESVAVENQTRAASLGEIYSDTGTIQEMAPEVSVLITSEKMPRPIHVAIPEYPVWARKQALSANVWVKAKVDAEGKIDEVEILSCDNPGVGFEESARGAALKSQFQPASSNGVNFAVWVIYPVRFIFKE